MTITNVKAMMAKVATVGLIAGALMVAAPTKAQAQVRFGVQIGGPVYHHGPVYAGPVYAAPIYGHPGYGYYGNRYEFERHAAYVRAEERARWERERFRGGYGYYGR